MLNDISSALTLLSTRRSGKPRNLMSPGPDAEQLRTILSIGMRTPDHGKLAPWRFVVVPPSARDDFAALLKNAYAASRPEAGRAEIDANEQFARQAPTLVVVLSAPVTDSKIPVWEQELSAGAAAMNILHAAHALGFQGGWLSGWAAYDETVRAALAGPGERIAGFIFIGTGADQPEERPRPDYDTVVRMWNG